jgi:type II restriction/modification system DNA methylase subunit YeeA
LTPQTFIAKWQAANLSERSACQQHFLDLCELLGQPKPAAADPEGAWYCFERGVSKSDGGQGWADVWMKDHFGWEYKGQHKDLKAAYNQLLNYRESLENPPLLVVCDLNRFEIHTNFTGTAKRVHEFDLAGLAEPKNLDLLRRLFTEPETLKPGLTTRSVTEQAAEHFGKLADGMRLRGIEAHEAAHFLMKLMFCMFAEDIDLLPSKLFSKSVQASKSAPERLGKTLRSLFEAMARGGMFGADEILYFNGGLFADAQVIDLTAEEIKVLAQAADFDWSVVEPHIFGTLFERTLDPAKRSQIGAHYTSSEDIKTLLEPVMMTPLRREWAAVRDQAEALLPKLAAEAGKQTRGAKESKPRKDFNKLIRDFVERLAHVSVLDPACGSGNFLYVGLRLLLDLNKEVIAFAARHGLGLFPQVRPIQLHGIEINPFAQELAQVVIWIGYLQWMRDNGFPPSTNPVLEPIESIERRDAIIDLTDPEHPKEPAWPDAEFIVGNPPFLGDKKMRLELGDEYVSKLRELFELRIRGQSDLCCYWFEKARCMIERGRAKRVGLLGTQGIRGGANRVVLTRIKETGDIFFGVGDRDWILDGATVHISMVGFDNGSDTTRTLDGRNVATINPNLTSASDTTTAKRISANEGRSFIGASIHGPFDLDRDTAVRFLASPNVHGRPNSDVVRTWANGLTITKRENDLWIVDVPPDVTEEEAAYYEQPFEFLRSTVLPVREKNRRPMRRKNWWILGDPQKAMRASLAGKPRFIITPRVSKYRIFVWATHPLLATDATVAFSATDDFFFGVLHSRAHELWALSQGTQLREKESGFRYTPSTCFETFPFPEPNDAQRAAIAAAAKELDQLRTNWLNPPEWTKTETLTFPGSADGPWARYVKDGVVHYPRLVPRDADCAIELKKRTLTNLYNARPSWLHLAHERLDEAVFAAYGWSSGMSDEELLDKLLALNLLRASTNRT